MKNKRRKSTRYRDGGGATASTVAICEEVWRICFHNSSRPAPVLDENGSMRACGYSCPSLRNAFCSCCFDNRSLLVATIKKSRPEAERKSSNWRSLCCGGTLGSISTTHNASEGRSFKYGSMNFGHSCDISREILA